MKNGKYRQYKKRGFPKKKDVVKAEIIFKENVKDPYKNITLEELFNVYAAYTEKRIKESTYKVQNRLLERWIDILGDVNIKSITKHDIEVAMELMINNVGYETAKNYLSRINKMLRFAVRKGYLESNPCSPIELDKNPNENNEEQIPIIRIHDLRHSCASYMIGNMVRDGNSNFSLYDVAKRLGDNLSTVLSVYSHCLPQADKGIAKLMDKDNALD